MFAPPVVVLFLYAALGWLARFPHRYNYIWPITEENAARQYRLARQMIVVIKAVMVGSIAVGVRNYLLTATGEAEGLGALYLPVVLGSITAVILLHVVLMFRAR